MDPDREQLIRTLRFELIFLRHGGYGRSVRTPWKASRIFQDSPTCLNFNEVGRPHACDACPLMQFVPPEHRTDEVPCHQIVLNENGDTIETLFNVKEYVGAEDELEEWLVTTIAKLESESGDAAGVQVPLSVGVPRIASRN